MTNMVLGVFSHKDDAEKAVNELEKNGFHPKDMSIVIKETVMERDQRTVGENVTQGAMSGATTGGVIGGLAGLLIGLGAIIIPGIGGLLIGGPLAAAIGLTGAAATTVSGALTGALAGGLVGALVGLGVPREVAEIYENRIKEGGVLLAVSAEDKAEEQARMIMEHFGANEVRSINVERS